jgi:hypothetical protein
MQFLFLTAIASAKPFTPLPPSEVAQFNQVIQQLIPGVNMQIGQIIKEKNLDPFPEVRKGALNAPFDVKLCKGLASLQYGIFDLKGLSNLQVKNATVISIDQEGDESTLTVVGELNPLDVAATLKADASVHCGRIYPAVSLSGNVSADQFSVSVNAKVTLASADSIKISKVLLETVNIDVIDVDVALPLDRLDGIANRIIDRIQFAFKNLILMALDKKLKIVLQQLIDAKLPFDAKL